MRALTDEQIEVELRHRMALYGMNPVEAFQSMLMLTDPELRKRFDKVAHDMKRRLGDVRHFIDPEIDGALVSNASKLVPWAPGVVGGHWDRFRDALVDDGSLQIEDIEALDRVSSVILNQALAHPQDPQLRPRRGLVVGHVQSGKTTNFTAVIAKAVDHGYRLVVVLTGMTDILRLQTQQRLDQALVTGGSEWIALTNELGDFVAPAFSADSVLDPKSNKPLIAVMKKNPAPLSAFKNWLEQLSPAKRQFVPFLVIDDECDQATPDTSPKGNRSRINALVEDICSPELLRRNVYLGYTATPFANLFMAANSQDRLFPSDFLLALNPGSNYFGSERIFGRDAIDDDGEPVDAVFDALRPIGAKEMLRIRKFNLGSDFVTKEGVRLAVRDNEIVSAIMWFALATAWREVRQGRREYSTLLIHTSSRTQDHADLSRHVVQPVMESMSAKHLQDDIWKCEFEKIWLQESAASAAVSAEDIPDFEDIWPIAVGVIGDMVLRIDNHQSDNRVSYPKAEAAYPRQPQVVVGGNTLSRGLTLEGLVVSYFLRGTIQYDTLLQMGRWFGYRVGYEDLVRIWMPIDPDVQDQYRSLALVEAELRDEIEAARRDGLAPIEAVPRVRQLARMRITRAAAMRNSGPVDVSFQGRRLYTSVYSAEGDILQRNLSLGKSFLRDLSTSRVPEAGRRNRPVFFDVDGDAIVDFLTSYHHEEVRDMGTLLPALQFIKDAQSKGLLGSWNVFVDSPPLVAGEDRSEIVVTEKLVLRTVRRARSNVDSNFIYVKTLSGSSDILVDVKQEYLPAEAQVRVAKSRISDYDLFKIRASAHTGPIDEAPALLGLHFIEKSYVPPAPSDGRIARKLPMNAPAHVLGISLMLPRLQRNDLAKNYVQLRPEFVAAVQPEDIEVDYVDEVVDLDA